MDISALSLTFGALIVSGIVFYLIALLVNQGTEISKALTRALADRIPGFNWAGVSGVGSYIAALVFTVVAVFFPGSGAAPLLDKVFSGLGITVDADMVKLLTTIAVWFLSMAQHDSGKLPSPLSASRKSK